MHKIRVFVVWEPVLPTDIGAPSTATLKRISDRRASQYWDRGRLLSHLLGEHDRNSIVWDTIAIYKPGQVWQKTPPEPAFQDNPVTKVIGRARQALQQQLTAARLLCFRVPPRVFPCGAAPERDPAAWGMP
jgi:hypothetical protein